MQAIISPTQRITVTVDMVDALIQQHPEDAARINRGVALVGSVERTNRPGVWLVYSASEDNRAYTVDAAGCSCPNYQKVGGWCKHRAGAYFFQQAERRDAEQSDPTPAPTHRCPACGRGWPTSDAMMACFDSHTEQSKGCIDCEDGGRESPEGMRRRCSNCPLTETWTEDERERGYQNATPDPAAPITLELTGRAYLTLIHSAALPPVVGTFAVQPMPAHLVALASELYDDYPQGAA